MNCLTAIGRLGRDPSSKEVNGQKVCAFSIAVDGRKDSAGGKKEPLWLEIRAWGKLAEICQKYLTKGKQVSIIGELRIEKWTGKDGHERTEVRVIADKVGFLGGGEQSKSAPTQSGRPTNGGVPRAQIPADDSDIPF